MLKWAVSKRLEPGGGDCLDITSIVPNISINIIDDGQQQHQQPNRIRRQRSPSNGRRSLGNLSQPIRNHRQSNGDHRRKSVGCNGVAKRLLKQNKENHILTTPHPMTTILHRRHSASMNNVTSTPPPPPPPPPTSQQSSASPSKQSTKINEFVFRDVSNINQTPTGVSPSITATTTPNLKRNLPLSPVTTVRRTTAQRPKSPLAGAQATVVPQQHHHNHFNQHQHHHQSNYHHNHHQYHPSQRYASTLPSFDIEYSPCGIKTISMINNDATTSTITTAAVSKNNTAGLTVHDTIFRNPCYFRVDDESDEPPATKRLKFSPEMTPLSQRLSELRFSKISIQRRFPLSSLKTTSSIKPSVNINNNNNTNNNNNNNNLDSDDSILSSKALNDTQLDKMIDDILESSRKISRSSEKKIAAMFDDSLPSLESKCLKRPGSPIISTAGTTTTTSYERLFKQHKQQFTSPQKIKLTNDRTIIIDDPSNTYLEREVRTPESMCSSSESLSPLATTAALKMDESPTCHLKRQRVVRRKHIKTKKLTTKTEDNVITMLPSIDDNILRKNIDLLAAMNTPKDNIRPDVEISSMKQQRGGGGGGGIGGGSVITSIGSKSSYDSTPNGIESTNYLLQGSSTPKGTHSIHHHYNHHNTLHQQQQQQIRRCLTFPESPDSLEDSIDKRKSVASSTTSRSSKSSSALLISGSLDLVIRADENTIQIHVIRCKDLCRSNGDTINAYVKVALLPTERSEENSFQRTAVQRNSTKPYFDHRFIFDRSTNDLSKRIQLAVWHRDRECKRSEFLGCMSFPIKTIIYKEINGSYKLQPQSCLTNPSQAIQLYDQSSMSSDYLLITSNNNNGGGEEATSIDECTTIATMSSTTTTTPSTTTQTTKIIPLSKKALNQQDADEHLILRFLELDEISELNDLRTLTPSDDGAGGENDHQHQRTSINGRTPFTITKQLTRSIDKGYGFSIVWTHPPRIEKIEPGLSAERAGIQPGDFVIFVDNVNVVTMPEMDILNLVRSQGNQLTLEIFRRSTQPSMQPIIKSICSAQRNSISEIPTINHINQLSSNIFSNIVSSSSLAPAPQPPPPIRRSIIPTNANTAGSSITFTKDIGSGVIV